MCVTSTSPLRAYLHREGLVRFATRPYDPSSCDGAAHVTNVSLTSRTACFVPNAAAADDDTGHKWSLAALRRRFAASGIAWAPLWARIGDLVARTLIAAAPRMAPAAAGSGAPPGACFELYGFDVLLDGELNPWLLEVNTGPNLAAPTPLDMHVKCRVAAEMLHLAGIAPAGVTAATAARLRRRMQQRAAATAAAAAAGGDVDALAEEEGEEAAAAAAARMAAAPLAPPLFVPTAPLATMPLCVRQMVAEEGRCGAFDRVFPSRSPARNAAMLPLLSPPCAGAAAMCAYIAARAEEAAMAAGEAAAADAAM